MILRYFWPVFAFLYPFAVWPAMPSHAGVVLAKQAFVLFFFAVGAFLEMWAHPQVRLGDLRRLPQALRNPPLALLLGLGLVMVLAALFSPERAVALTGSVSDNSDGLFFGLAMLGVALLVYLRAREDPKTLERVAWGLVLGGGLLALLALGEVLLGRGFFYATAAPADLPTVTFPQKGHLAGYFVLVAGAALGLRSPWALFLAALGVGLAFNRAGLLALGVLALLALWRAPRHGLVALLALALGVGAGMGTVRLAAQGPLPGGGAVREVASPSTLFSRLYYWKAALGGIAARPLLGWGGGVFEHRWPAYLSEADLEGFLRAEFGDGQIRLLGVANAPGGDPVFFFQRSDGKFAILRLYGFRAHNQFLEVGLKWGLLGLGLYLGLLLFGLRGLMALAPGATALLGVHVFFLLWFAIPEGEGALWALWGAALGSWRR
jgi:O-antigen ligase